MDLRRAALEQHIAVFGESGSGKTVLLSSFYGATQEPSYLKRSLCRVVADDFGQGTRLHRNYLGMKESAHLPEPTRFSTASYSFSVKLKDAPNSKAIQSRPFEALRLVWHDYPGEWFEQDVSGPEEGQRRIDAFRSLLGSDVALLLVDGQRLLDNAGEEERYLKSLLGNFRNSLLRLRDDLLPEGSRLERFPRIWIMALSKSDLLPNMNVFSFRDLMVEKVADEMDELRQVLEGFVAGSDALAVGEDFVLLSSAKFSSDKIEVSERVGLDLILPLASILPFERHVRWANAKQLPGKVTGALLETAGPLAATLLGGAAKKPGPVGLVSKLISMVLSKELLENAARLAGDALGEANATAVAKHDYMRATLTGFKLGLAEGEEAEVLLRSLR